MKFFKPTAEITKKHLEAAVNKVNSIGAVLQDKNSLVGELNKELQINATFTGGLPGMSSYEIWLGIPGNEGKTVQQFIDYLKANVHLHNVDVDAHPNMNFITDVSYDSTVSEMTFTMRDGREITITVNAASGGVLVRWTDIIGKPSTFTPSPHTHSIEEIEGLSQALIDATEGENWRINIHENDFSIEQKNFSPISGDKQILTIKKETTDANTKVKIDGVTEIETLDFGSW